MKSSLFYWEQEKGQSVILVQFGIHWLPGWYGEQWLFMKSSLFYWEQESGRSVIFVQFGIHWLLGWYGGQWFFMKSSLFYCEQEKGQSVILVQFGIHWLPGWYGEQWLLLKPPFIYCRQKPDIRASYHHISSNSENVTAYMLYNFSSLSTDLTKNELKWLLMRYELTLVWHCAGSLFYKIDCRLLLKEIVSYEMSSPCTWHEERSKN